MAVGILMKSYLYFSQGARLARVKLKVRDRDKGFKAFERALEDDKKHSHAAVGIIGAGEELKKAIGNEFGNKKKKIPPRAFIRQTFDNNIKEIKSQAKILSIHVIEGKLSKTQALERLGDLFKSMIFKAIANREFAENAESTKKAKGSDLPLVGKTGRMQQSIKTEVR